jgi:hypothetical protein
LFLFFLLLSLELIYRIKTTAEYFLCTSLEETLLLYKARLLGQQFVKLEGSLYKLTGDLVLSVFEGGPVGNGGAFYIVLKAMLDILTTMFGF